MALALCIALAACGPRAEAPASAEATASCAAGATERRPLILPDGQHAYVEPVNLMRVGESFVVAGSPTYTWAVGGARVVQTSAGAHIAAYLDEEAPRMVENPIDGRVGVVRTVPLDDRRWGALFTETDSREDWANGNVIALWYAEYDGEAWSNPEVVPLPADTSLRLGFFNSSQLVRFEGGLSWVAADLRSATYRYERLDGRWSTEVAETHGGEATAMAADASGLWLAVSGLDPAISEPRKSIRLFRWRDAWELVHRFPTGETYSEIRKPKLTAVAEGLSLTWREEAPGGRTTARARVGITVDDPGAALLLDDDPLRAEPVALPDGSMAWAVEHPNPISIELRLVREQGGEARRVATYFYPYTGWYAAVAAGPDEVLVTGSEFDPDPARPTVRSLTLRLNLSCH
jgi:hypothetical protein